MAMKITILGAGAIGGLAGAYMTRAGHDTTLVDRWAEHVQALNAQGLRIDGVRGDLTVPVRAGMNRIVVRPLDHPGAPAPGGDPRTLLLEVVGLRASLDPATAAAPAAGVRILP